MYYHPNEPGSNGNERWLHTLQISNLIIRCCLVSNTRHLFLGYKLTVYAQKVTPLVKIFHNKGQKKTNSSMKFFYLNFIKWDILKHCTWSFWTNFLVFVFLYNVSSCIQQPSSEEDSGIVEQDRYWERLESTWQEPPPPNHQKKKKMNKLISMNWNTNFFHRNFLIENMKMISFTKCNLRKAEEQICQNTESKRYYSAKMYSYKYILNQNLGILLLFNG